MTAEQMQAVIDRADAGKLERARKASSASQSCAGARAAPAEIRGAVMGQWGRKIYQIWPSRNPVWTISAFFGAVVFFLLTLAVEYARAGRSSSGFICRFTRRPGYMGCSRRRIRVSPDRRRDRERAAAACSRGRSRSGEMRRASPCMC